jgi:putative zinc finger protein
MTSMAGCREIRQALGVYVLGAIDPAERALVDSHLATCPECREELAALAGLPALLRRIPVTEAERLALPGADGLDEPSEELLHSLLARAQRVRHGRRWRGLVAAAAAVVLALGIGAVASAALQPSGPASIADLSLRWHTVSGTNAVTGTKMTVKYVPMAWGTLMNVQVSGPSAGTVCELEVTDSAGHWWVVGGWKLSYRGGPAWYPASTWVPEPEVRSFELTSGGRVLAHVKAPPDD